LAPVGPRHTIACWVDVTKAQETRVAPAAILEGVAQMEPPPAPEPDDLKRIEGVGPKIAGVLQAAGIATFAQLAASNADQIEQTLNDADPNLANLADPTSWPQQAQLAAEGKWDELEALQDELKGGR